MEKSGFSTLCHLWLAASLAWLKDRRNTDKHLELVPMWFISLLPPKLPCSTCMSWFYTQYTLYSTYSVSLIKLLPDTKWSTPHSLSPVTGFLMWYNDHLWPWCLGTSILDCIVDHSKSFEKHDCLIYRSIRKHAYQVLAHVSKRSTISHYSVIHVSKPSFIW